MSEVFDEKKKQIKEAAIKVFAHYGFNKTSMDDIANAVGMKKNSLYYYFPNKESLFDAVFTEEVNKFYGEFEKFVKSDFETIEKITKAANYAVNKIRTKSNLYSVSVQAGMELTKIIDSSYQDFYNKIVGLYAEMFQEGIDKGTFKKHNTNEIASTLFYTINAIEFKEIYITKAEFLHEMDYSKIDKMVNTILTYILEGLKVHK